MVCTLITRVLHRSRGDSKLPTSLNKEGKGQQQGPLGREKEARGEGTFPSWKKRFRWKKLDPKIHTLSHRKLREENSKKYMMENTSV